MLLTNILVTLLVTSSIKCSKNNFVPPNNIDSFFLNPTDETEVKT